MYRRRGGMNIENQPSMLEMFLVQHASLHMSCSWIIFVNVWLWIDFRSNWSFSNMEWFGIALELALVSTSANAKWLSNNLTVLYTTNTSSNSYQKSISGFHQRTLYYYIWRDGLILSPLTVMIVLEDCRWDKCHSSSNFTANEHVDMGYSKVTVRRCLSIYKLKPGIQR